MNQHRSWLFVFLERCLSWHQWSKNTEEDGITMCMWFLKVSQAITSIEQRQSLLTSIRVSGKTVKLSFKTNVTALPAPTPSAGFHHLSSCVGSGCVREEFTPSCGGWLRCCVVSKVDEKFRTTLCNYWQCFVLSTLKHAFGFEMTCLCKTSLQIQCYPIYFV